MMCLSRCAGVFAVIPTTVLLTVSFFVLVVIKKIEGQGLKAFGYVVAAFLWVSSLIMFSSGVYVMATGKPMFMKMHHEKKMMMQCPMMSGTQDKMMEQGKDAMPEKKMEHKM